MDTALYYTSHPSAAGFESALASKGQMATWINSAKEC